MLFIFSKIILSDLKKPLYNIKNIDIESKSIDIGVDIDLENYDNSIEYQLSMFKKLKKLKDKLKKIFKAYEEMYDIYIDVKDYIFNDHIKIYIRNIEGNQKFNNLLKTLKSTKKFNI